MTFIHTFSSKAGVTDPVQKTPQVPAFSQQETVFFYQIRSVSRMMQSTRVLVPILRPVYLTFIPVLVETAQQATLRALSELGPVVYMSAMCFLGSWCVQDVRIGHRRIPFWGVRTAHVSLDVMGTKHREK
jgi:hypothetical protein